MGYSPPGSIGTLLACGVGSLQRPGALTKRCDKCSAYKPPRAHHCRVCRRCVLKMDHHCTWINNCVGQRNYKAFFLLVFYGTISSLYSTVIIVGCGVQKDWESFGTTRLKTFYRRTKATRSKIEARSAKRKSGGLFVPEAQDVYIIFFIYPIYAVNL
ncbi:putative protein S-acyltransferase [Helianthus anomalus]